MKSGLHYTHKGRVGLKHPRHLICSKDKNNLV